MSTKRSHRREVGCVACEELGDVGAGKEGWLVEDPNLLCALETHSIAFANRSLIIIAGWDDGPGSRLKIRPDLSPIESEYICAMDWLVIDDIRLIAVGTSRGNLLLYVVQDPLPLLVHTQLVFPARILKFRACGNEKPDDGSSGHLSVVMPGVVARFDALDIRKMIQEWLHQTNSPFWNENLNKVDTPDAGSAYKKLPYQLWNVDKYGSSADAAITGIMPPPLLEIQSDQRYYRAVVIGDDAVISAYRLSEDRSRSLVGAILSKFVPATFSTIASFSKMIWRGEQTPPKKVEGKPQSFAKASPLTCLKDHPRKGEKLTLSPSGTLAAITDSLGRILLLDTQALVVVRLWKGYRDASCLFMEMLINRHGSRESSSYYEPSKSDYCLCLAIHAPRKRIIEVWEMRTGPRLLTIQCGKGSKILQPSYRFGSSSDSPYVPLQVFLLDGESCQLSVLNHFLN